MRVRSAPLKGSGTMGHGARRWLVGLGTAATAGACVLAQAGAASAAGDGPARMSGQASAASGVVPGSVYVPARASLTLGMRGPAVRALQSRLNFLHYYAGRANGYFGWPTMEAVWAFKEVQSGKAIPGNPDVVGPTMQRQLVHPRLPKVLRPHGPATRIEINKNVGVLVLYRRGKVILVSHVATAASCRPDGCGWVTPDGRYRALWFAPGWVGGSLGSMYNPIVFTPNGAYAIHGEPNPTSLSQTISYDGVPLSSASHGCVRIPMDIANILYKMIPIGRTKGIVIYIAGGPQPH